MSKLPKIDLSKFLTEHWALIMRAHAQTISRQTFSEEEVQVLKSLAAMGVLDLMWSKTAHDFSETIKAYLGGKQLEALHEGETQQLIAYLVENSSKWFTRTIQCNWK
ncbi:hypothetical protein ICV01_03310 [Polynucleobacter sp. MWH-Spelu-300-X4]|uniref:hypothetical protein n=1 Tax=Polynucleobacter sp. MWH-Spelu-300-X4 TaxID=2689109 RepID=UPI001BFE9A78|nr:hypothetical protein [Polynucleobacter sp. MWH-Spelu-300-X4]QWD80354.1 hypothetical protein ICV01_03310 [Polynucleobacter sp. MWH-Spelu-300-X4]